MPKMNLDESPAVQEWRQKRDQELAAKQAEWKQKHDQTLAKARKEIDQFYADYNQKKQKAQQSNRDLEKKLKSEEAAPAKNVWERVTGNIDFNATPGQSSVVVPKDKQDPKDKNKQEAKPETKRDLSRFKSLLLQLKNDSKAPGNQVSAH